MKSVDAVPRRTTARRVGGRQLNLVAPLDLIGANDLVVHMPTVLGNSPIGLGAEVELHVVAITPR
jgi:hypothetical protein